nr:MAG TPA_asm: hypothetical protein [Caudoviricetes sp.]
MALFDQPRSAKIQNYPQNNLTGELKHAWCYDCISLAV